MAQHEQAEVACVYCGLDRLEVRIVAAWNNLQSDVQICLDDALCCTMQHVDLYLDINRQLQEEYDTTHSRV